MQHRGRVREGPRSSSCTRKRPKPPPWVIWWKWCRRAEGYVGRVSAREHGGMGSGHSSRLEGRGLRQETGVAHGRRHYRASVLPAGKFAGHDGAGALYGAMASRKGCRYSQGCGPRRFAARAGSDGGAGNRVCAGGIRRKTQSFCFCGWRKLFFEIAKLRAARQLWARLSKQPLVIWSRTSFANKSLYDPSANLLRCTTEAMSAIFGGCDYLIVEPARFPQHLADGVARILREESHFDQVSDPGGGSYYIEWLTAAIAAEAWRVYESGLSGREAAITASRAAKEKLVALRKRTLVGVNNYPDLTETLPPDAKLPGAAWRMAKPFEEIRQRVEKSGKRPRVLLLQRGQVKMRMARANFCLNLFGCAGFDVKTSDTLEPADLVV